MPCSKITKEWRPRKRQQSQVDFLLTSGSTLYQERGGSRSFATVPPTYIYPHSHNAGMRDEDVVFCSPRALWRFEGDHRDVILGPSAYPLDPSGRCAGEWQNGKWEMPESLLLVTFSEAKSRHLYGACTDLRLYSASSACRSHL
jgi:hypothetical protein